MTSFSQGFIKQKEPERQACEQAYRDFLASGRQPIIGTPTSSAYDFTKKQSQKARNDERRQRQGIDKKPKSSPIRSVAYVHKRMKGRGAAGECT